ncbi:MAG: hypothetical protein HC906_09635, partial [Bacteroidales bacterium]|nr:hypothetical protein [Bacteroidales bacterium]
MPLIEDEAIRALVGLEMLIKHDFFCPSIGGEAYLKKPPLFNWIIAGFFSITNNYSEFVIRLPMLFSLLSFGVVIFLFLRKKNECRICLFYCIGIYNIGKGSSL